MAKQVGDILLKNVVQGEKKGDAEVYGQFFLCTSGEREGGNGRAQLGLSFLFPFELAVPLTFVS